MINHCSPPSVRQALTKKSAVDRFLLPKPLAMRRNSLFRNIGSLDQSISAAISGAKNARNDAKSEGTICFHGSSKVSCGVGILRMRKPVLPERAADRCRRCHPCPFYHEHDDLARLHRRVPHGAESSHTAEL